MLSSVYAELPQITSLTDPSRDFALRVYTPLKLGKKPVGIITNVIVDWKRSVTYVGGPWRGSFKIYAPEDILEQWFYDRLGYHIEEHSYGQKLWSGLVWEMDLVTVRGKRSKRRRRSYEDIFNYVRCDYTDPDTGVTGSTSWYLDQASINRYGRKEEIIQRNLDATNAAEAAQEFLELSAPGAVKLVGIEQAVEQSYLEVTVAGYVATASFRFTATADDSSSTVSGWVDDILTTDTSEFLIKWTVATNSRSIKQSLTTPTRALSILEDLLTLRDGSGNRFNIFVRPSRRILYYQIDPTPIGIIRNGNFHSSGGVNLEDTPRLVGPGIYRDMDYAAGTKGRRIPTSSSFFLVPADFLLETVEVDEKGTISPRLGVYADEEALSSFTFKDKKK